VVCTSSQLFFVTFSSHISKKILLRALKTLVVVKTLLFGTQEYKIMQISPVNMYSKNKASRPANSAIQNSTKTMDSFLSNTPSAGNPNPVAFGTAMTAAEKAARTKLIRTAKKQCPYCVNIKDIMTPIGKLGNVSVFAHKSGDNPGRIILAAPPQYHGKQIYELPAKVQIELDEARRFLVRVVKKVTGCDNVNFGAYNDRTKDKLHTAHGHLHIWPKLEGAEDFGQPPQMVAKKFLPQEELDGIIGKYRNTITEELKILSAKKRKSWKFSDFELPTLPSGKA